MNLKARIDNIIGGLGHVTPVEGEDVRWPIDVRMKTYGVPGISLAIIDGGELAWSGGFGAVDTAGSRAVDEDTIFQAASMSKPVAAFAIMKAFEAGRFDLDRDINEYLAGWKLPASPLTEGNPVTLRRIMSHTAGLTVWGFGGYAEGESLPTVPQVLSGEPPANSPPVFVDTAPGSLERYSGGGTTIAQLAITEAFDMPYEEILQREVLAPLAMYGASFEQTPPPDRMTNAAAGHDWDGTTIPGRWHRYVEQAAAGLWTSAADYARFLLGLQAAYAGVPGSLLSLATAREMASKPPGAVDFALGPKIIGRGNAVRFQHGGSNHGYMCGSNAFLDGSRGVVVMTNSNSGAAIAEEVINAVAREFDWPDYLRSPRRKMPLGADRLDRYTGTYMLAEGAPFPLLEIFTEGTQLMYRLGTLASRPIFAESDCRFFSPESLYDTVFALDDRGEATALTVMDGDKPVLAGTRQR